MVARNNFHIFTGGPGAGKTTVLEVLQARGYPCVEETGRKIIQEQKATGGNIHHNGDRIAYRDLMLSRAIYTANFAEQRDIADDATLALVLSKLGVNPEATVEAANTQENKDRLKAQTEEAISRGLFGAPSFTVGDELFWGNDRLEQAVAWAAKN
jgi:2-hydroxychromene-2-carboxylate isomerase